jgi:hypothetical protein
MCSYDSLLFKDQHFIPGSEVALVSLIRANVLHPFLLALSNIKPHDPVQLKSALARGLRVLSTAIAEAVGPSQLGLRTWSSDLRSEANVALSYLFEVNRFSSIKA